LELATLDDRGALFRLGEIVRRKRNEIAMHASMWLAGTDVLALAATQFGVVFVGRNVPGRKWGIVFLGQQMSSRALPFDGEPSTAFFGYGGSLAHRTFGLAAIEQSDSKNWFVITQSADLEFGTVGGAGVVGAVLDPRHHQPSLISLKDDHRTLTLSGPYSSFERRLPAAAAEIVAVTVGTAQPNIAYSTVEGEVVVYSLARRADLCRFQPGGER
jgi:hypothetical protein